jgi:hypothetical protein
MFVIDEYLKDYKILRDDVVDDVRVIVVIPLKQIESVKDAKKKYYEKNKDEINGNIAEWRRNKMKNDPEFKERAMEASRRYREKNKKGPI